jgi:gas vesicle protein
MGQESTEVTTPADIEATRADLSRDIDELNDKINPARVMDRKTQAVKGKLGSVKDKVMGGSAGFGPGDSTSNVTGAVSDKASGALDTVGAKAQGNPLAAGLVAFGAGMVIASLIPASQKETETAQRAVEAMKEHGQPLVDEAKSVGQEMGQELKDSAVDSAQQVKAAVQESAENVKQEGQSSARTVKDEASTTS